MSMDLDGFRQQVSVFLIDPEGNIWDPASLDEAIRLALSDLQRISPIKLSILGLDEATITGLDGGMAELLVKGAAAYALEMRIIDRADMYELNQTGLDMSGWVEKVKQRYLLEIEKMRRAYLQKSANAPHFTLPDPDGL